MSSEGLLQWGGAGCEHSSDLNWGLESEAKSPSQQNEVAALGPMQRGKQNGTLEPDWSGFESQLLHAHKSFLRLSLSFLSYKMEGTTPSSWGCHKVSSKTNLQR